tara:strand:+ start:286 stop:810 length:525 start_codon:yes stop_codon:yes gene_type:complete
MALWGKSDLVYNSGTVNLHYAEKEIRRHGGTVDFVQAGVKTGDVIAVGAGRTVGQAVISGVVGVHTVSIASTQFLTYVPSNTVQNLSYYINQKPKSSIEDTNYSALPDFGNGTPGHDVQGIDDSEVSEASSAGIGSYAQHAGWVGIITYTDAHGNFRRKAETLVAMSGITSDRT